MTVIRFVGDIHGKYRSYMDLIAGMDASVQIGDFGIGFAGVCYEEKDRIINEHVAGSRHRFIRGNHDNPARCRQMHGYIADGTIENDVMYIGGAWSIDRNTRCEGVDWWRDEELSYEELERLINIVEVTQPRVLITHDGPSSITYENFTKPRGWTHFKTRTGEAFEEMFQVCKPELHIFGHWHIDTDIIVDGTRFICLGELSHIDIDLDNHTGDEKIISWNSFRSANAS